MGQQETDYLICKLARIVRDHMGRKAECTVNQRQRALQW